MKEVLQQFRSYLEPFGVTTNLQEWESISIEGHRVLDICFTVKKGDRDIAYFTWSVTGVTDETRTQTLNDSYQAIINTILREGVFMKERVAEAFEASTKSKKKK